MKNKEHNVIETNEAGENRRSDPEQVAQWRPSNKDRQSLSRFVQELNAGKSFDELNESLRSWWLGRY